MNTESPTLVVCTCSTVHIVCMTILKHLHRKHRKPHTGSTCSTQGMYDHFQEFTLRDVEKLPLASPLWGGKQFGNRRGYTKKVQKNRQ